MSGVVGLLALVVVATPELRDPSLQMTLFAESPDIVTPIGLDVDRRGRVLVVESHTHLRPPEYTGPLRDRVKLLEDADGDGRADRVGIFADGFEDAMNLTVARDGTVVVVTRAEVVALRDRDGDGRADTRAVLMRSETRERYPHAGLLGVVEGPDGWLYVSRGNLAGAPHRLVGSDGRSIEAYGEGGNIVRLRMDGRGLERVATGFWNPFQMVVDGAGRLLAVDNDPDSRGPNRLVHVVPGGDYGYHARFGPSGLHPMSAWAGEWPGTLGYVSPVGESPAGLVDAERAALPPEYAGSVLVGVWAENTIERHRFSPRGASVTAMRDVLVKGGEDFRPVALAAAPDGAVFVSDWVKRDYPNHGAGRIWRLSARAGVTVAPPRPPYLVRADAGMARLAETRALRSAPALLRALCDDDAFVRAVAIGALARNEHRGALTRALGDTRACVRLGALLASRQAAGHRAPLPPPPGAPWARLLSDVDLDVRRVALRWAGETGDAALRPLLARVLATAPVSPELVRAYLAATRMLDEEERDRVARRAPWSKGDDAPDAALVAGLASDARLPLEARTYALRMLAHVGSGDSAWLGALVGDAAEPVRLEAARLLATHEAGRRWLTPLAGDVAVSPALRAEAIAALAAEPEVLAGALADPSPLVRVVAARTARVAPRHPALRRALELRLGRDGEREGSIREALLLAHDPAAALAERTRPSDAEAWRAATVEGGDPAAGRLVFQHSGVGCLRCHAIAGRGGRVGPDLSHVASSIDRRRILDAILEPSGNVSPEYQAYVVTKKDGSVLEGTQLHWRGGGDAATLLLLDGRTVTVRGSEVARVDAPAASLMPQGLEQTMTVSEVRDLLAFLETCR